MISDNEFVDQMVEMTKRHIQRRNSLRLIRYSPMIRSSDELYPLWMVMT